MNFIQYDLGQLNGGEVANVTLRERANVLLMDHQNFMRYRSGHSYNYVGGQALRSPIRLQVPGAGHWHVVLDLGGNRGTIHSNVTLSR